MYVSSSAFFWLPFVNAWRISGNRCADSRLCAEMEFQRRQNGYFDLTQYGQDSMGANPDLYYNEYAVITYKLAVIGE